MSSEPSTPATGSHVFPHARFDVDMQFFDHRQIKTCVLGSCVTSRSVLEHFTLAPGTVISYGVESLPETHALRNTGADEILIVTTELL